MTAERANRKLAAIVAADMVGYSALMERDEEGTLARFNAIDRDVVRPAVTAHRGRVVKTTGDGFLIEFASVVDAMRFAVDVQRAMKARGEAASEPGRYQFRIGVNLGDVIIEGDDIFGEGVNIAARLEGIAPPGGICLSRAVRDQLGNKLDVPFEDMGPQRLKNIAVPVEAHRVRFDAAPAPPPAVKKPEPVHAYAGAAPAPRPQPAAPSTAPPSGSHVPGMKVAEIIDFYREHQRSLLQSAWERLKETSFGAVRSGVKNFDPYLWSLNPIRVSAPSARREALALWCHQRSTGRWMFNELPTNDVYLFEQRADSERFKEELKAET
jgi:class 3 adenylate cyclase